MDREERRGAVAVLARQPADQALPTSALDESVGKNGALVFEGWRRVLPVAWPGVLRVAAVDAATCWANTDGGLAT